MRFCAGLHSRAAGHTTAGYRNIPHSTAGVALPEVAPASVRQRVEPAQQTTPSPEQLQRNKELVERLHGKLILAPLTRAGNLPFRRLCCSFGAEATMGEMSYARQLIKGCNAVEQAHLRQADNEHCYGFQMACNQIDEGIRAAERAAEAGAAWVDLNCGCPIHEATRRGLGAALLRKPHKLERLVRGIAAGSPVPLTVKIRLGTGENDRGNQGINVMEVVEALQDTGAAAISIHGRTMRQRYSRAANWDLVAEAAQRSRLPVLGNGDVLTRYEAARRLASGCHAVLVGRGALIRPWIFAEVRDARCWHPTAAERVGIYRRLACYMREAFKDDARGKRMAWHFLPFGIQWMQRYRPLPEDVYGQQAHEYPLIATRFDVAAAALGEELDSLSLLERLLRSPHEEAHEAIAQVVWEAASDAEAVQQLQSLAGSRVVEWEQEVRQGGRGEGDSTANEGWG